jgi:hypothetical protein
MWSSISASPWGKSSLRAERHITGNATEELKTGDFEPANAGQLNFYIKAVDSQWRKDGDNPTIGLLLCKSRDKLIAEYAMSDIHKPMGVSEYKLTHKLPQNLKSSLPTIAEIEKELSKSMGRTKK